MNNELLKAEYRHLIETGKQLEAPVPFYSTPSAGMMLTVSHGTVALDGRGMASRIGEKVCQFTQIGSEKNPDDPRNLIPYGVHFTKDPEVALFLLERSETLDDVITKETYLERVTPAGMKVEQAVGRAIAAENTLLALMADNERKDAEMKNLRDQINGFKGAQAKADKQSAADMAGASK